MNSQNTKDQPQAPSTPPTGVTPGYVAPMSLWQALRAAGWWSGIDSTLSFLIVMVWVTGIFWKIFGDPGVLNLIALLLASLSLNVVWATIVGFRAARFVLDVRSDINLMPEAAARIAAAFITGK